jgi:hypothetical protein
MAHCKQSSQAAYCTTDLLYAVFCILYSIFCILYSIFCILYSIFWNLYSIFWILYSVFCILYSVFLGPRTGWYVPTCSYDILYDRICVGMKCVSHIPRYLSCSMSYGCCREPEDRHRYNTYTCIPLPVKYITWLLVSCMHKPYRTFYCHIFHIPTFNLLSRYPPFLFFIMKSLLNQPSAMT